MRIGTAISTIALIGALKPVLAEEIAPPEATIEDARSTPPSVTNVILENGEVILLVDGNRTPLPLSSAAVAILRQEDRLYVALGRHGAVIFDISQPGDVRQVEEVPPSAKEISGFSLVDGEVWMREVTTTIVPMPPASSPSLRDAPSSATLAKHGAPSSGGKEKSPATPPKPGKEVRILSVQPGSVTLNLGARDGVRVGDQYSVLREVRVRGAKSEAFLGTELAAVVEVIAVNPNRCLAVLGRGDRVTPEGIVQSRHPDHRSSNIYPRHLTHLGEISVTLRPILNVVDGIGFGALNNLSASYWGKGFFVQLLTDPLGFAFTNDGNILLTTLALEGGFDSRSFAIGLGVGMNSTSFKKNAFAITQVVRLGARDGLNLELRNSFNLRMKQNDNDYTGENEEEVLGFEWGGISGRFNIPLTSRTDLYFEGGGSPAAHFYSEVGLFAWIIGNGDAGSLGLSAAAGAAGFDVTSHYNETTYDYEGVEAVGPMISLGLDYRFGFKKR